MSAEELRSDITCAISIASETDTFFELALARRTTHAFARGHLEYLRAQADDLLKEFRESIPDAQIADAYPDSRTLVSSLTQQLSSGSQVLNDPAALAAVQQHIGILRMALEALKSSL